MSGALHFDANSERLSHGSGSSLDDHAAGTYIAWINVTTTSSFTKYIIHKGLSSGYRDLAMSSAGPRLQFDVHRATGDLSVRALLSSFVPTLTALRWLCIAAAYDTAGASADQILYAGNTDVLMTPPSSYVTQLVGSGAPVSNAADNLYVGNHGSVNNLSLQGRCAFAGVWNRRLTLHEIRKIQWLSMLMASHRGVSSHRDVARAVSGNVLCTFPGMTPGAVIDWSGFGNHGIPSGPTLAAGIQNRRRVWLMPFAHRPSAGNTYNETVSEALAVVDSQDSVATLPAALSEAVVVADSQDSAAILPAALSEAVGVADSQSSVATLPAELSEAVVAADVQSALAILLAEISESLALADSSDATVGGVYDETVIEAVTAADSAAAELVAVAVQDEALAVSDAAAALLVAQAAQADALALSDDAGAAASLVAAIAELLATTDSAQASVEGIASVLEALMLSDTYNDLSAIFVIVIDAQVRDMSPVVTVRNVSPTVTIQGG